MQYFLLKPITPHMLRYSKILHLNESLKNVGKRRKDLFCIILVALKKESKEWLLLRGFAVDQGTSVTENNVMTKKQLCCVLRSIGSRILVPFPPTNWGLSGLFEPNNSRLVWNPILYINWPSGPCFQVTFMPCNERDRCPIILTILMLKIFPCS